MLKEINLNVNVNKCICIDDLDIVFNKLYSKYIHGIGKKTNRKIIGKKSLNSKKRKYIATIFK